MSIIANNLLQGDEGYNLTRSLRFRSSASAYLNRTPASATNDNTWTWSSWVKRGELGYKNIYSTANSIGSNTTLGQFSFVNDNLYFFLYTGVTIYSELFTTAVFRDPSAWYHIVLQYDDTQATSSNRVKIYVNGVQQTLTGSYPSQNFNGFFNTAQPHVIGRYAGSGSANYFDGYMAEINFIDGQALTPSSFGETDVLTGVWKPKKYAGTYGTNGFYLPFTDNASTTTLGYDFSGNSNNWTTNNISLTAGTTYDSMIDVPTLSALASNYCVMNPLNKNSNHTITDGNLTITSSSYGGAAATFGISTGKWYHESTITNRTSNNSGAIGYCNENYKIATELYFPNTTDAFGVNAIDGAAASGTSTSYGSAFSSGDVIMLAFDADAKKMWVGKNGTWFASGDPVAGTNYYPKTITGNTFFPAVNCFGDTYAYNFGQRPFAYTPPTGFVALNTFNLPEPSIKAGNKQMDVSLYTGNGTARSITNSGSIQPDFVWIKNRTSGVFWHQLYDVNRGALKALFSNDTSSESTYTDTLTAFTSTGFNLGTDATFNGGVNKSGDAYVGWQWKAGGTAVTNTAGSITSQVSANTTSGFSIVTYTGTGSAATVGHGLGVAPSMIIIKPRNSVTNWVVGQASAGWDAVLNLNTTSATASGTGAFGAVSPTSSVFTVAANGGSYNTNQSTTTYVAYCFAEVAGYSKFGSYTGNGSADGTFVYTGFRPKFIMIKNTSAVGSWEIQDTSRAPSNVMNAILQANTSNAEITAGRLDGLSNGFKLRTASDDLNTSGSTYIYMAFCENPFRNALAR